jgi:hypothetical protein
VNSGGWGSNPNKYLLRNGNGWWLRVQPYDPAKTERLAFNLKTRDLEEARKRRDEMIAATEWRFSR